MNFHTSAEVKGGLLGLVTAIFDGESQTSKEVISLHSLTVCSERCVSGLSLLLFKE